MRFGFVGPAYTLDSVLADIQRCVNFYPENVESERGKSPMVLRGTPGLTLFTTLGQSAVKAAAIAGGGAGYTANDILTVVGGTPITAATLKVVTVAAGVITAVTVETGGYYTVDPTNPVSVTGGTGTGATFNLTMFASIIGRVSGMITCLGVKAGNPRIFAVAGTDASSAYLFEINSDGTNTPRGTLTTNMWAGQASMAYNETQLLIACGPIESWVFTFATNALVQNAAGFTPVLVDYCDGYFIANSGQAGQRFYISALKNGASWNALDFSEADQIPDPIYGLAVIYNELWLFGQNGTQPYFNSGNRDFPFEPIKGAYMECGTAAAYSVLKIGQSIFWLGHERAGRGIVWRADGHQPVRISTHAIEVAIRSYTVINDAVAWGYQDQGHTFYVLTFPTANKTWVYDLATQLWHERMYLLGGATETAHLGICSTFGLWEATPFKGRQLLGARNSGKIYDMRSDVYLDDGDTIRRIRRCPHISNEEAWTFYHALQVDAETGLAANQSLFLRWSVNGGKTWCSYKEVLAGSAVSSSGVTAVAINFGGSGYVVGDVLTVVGGVGGAATLTVSAVTAGVITAVTITTPGTYTENPTNPVSVTGGAGILATFNLTIPGFHHKRVCWRQLGRARDMVFELMVHDAVKWTIADAYLRVSPGEH